MGDIPGAGRAPLRSAWPIPGGRKPQSAGVFNRPAPAKSRVARPSRAPVVQPDAAIYRQGPMIRSPLPVLTSIRMRESPRR